MEETSNVSLGRVRLISDPSAYQDSFARFPGDKLNGWISEKENYCGQEGRVIRVFSDRTVTIRFDDGAQLDFPFESIAEQVSVVDIINVSLGRVRLIADPTAYQDSFTRFQGDELNGWIPEKETYCGKDGKVIRVFCDQTVTIRFDDGVQLDFPFESIAEQVSVEVVPKPAEVWRIADGVDFQNRFGRFVGDKLNYWSEAKDLKKGMCGIIMKVYGDQTVTMLFEDLLQFDFPFEALEDAPAKGIAGFSFQC